MERHLLDKLFALQVPDPETRVVAPGDQSGGGGGQGERGDGVGVGGEDVGLGAGGEGEESDEVIFVGGDEQGEGRVGEEGVDLGGGGTVCYASHRRDWSAT